MGSVIRIQRPLIVAVCGDSGSGKTTLTDGMVRVFGQERVTHICLDDYHTLDRAARLRKNITALHPDANNIPLMTEHLRRSEEHTSELQSHRDLHSFPTRRSSDLL